MMTTVTLCDIIIIEWLLYLILFSCSRPLAGTAKDDYCKMYCSLYRAVNTRASHLKKEVCSVARRTNRLWFAVSSLCVLLTACRSLGQTSSQDRQFFAMDTFISLTAYGDGASAALDAAQQEIQRLEALLSVTVADSDLSQVNHAEGKGVVLHEDTAQLLSFALTMSDLTGGAVTPAIYPAVAAWGFTTDHVRVPTQQELDDLLPLLDYRTVTLKENTVTLPAGAQLDFGSVAKGWAGDRVLALWREAGLTSGILRLGGNIQTLGAKPDGSAWVIGIRDPAGENALATLSVCDMAVVTSGNYERYFERDGRRYCHIIDPSTARPVDNGLASVTVVSQSGAYCDALSTALFVMGAEQAGRFWQAHRDFEAVLIDTDGKILITDGLRDSFQLTADFSEREVRVLS